MMTDLWWRVRCLIGWHDWFHFNRGKICECCGKAVRHFSLDNVDWPRK